LTPIPVSTASRPTVIAHPTHGLAAFLLVTLSVGCTAPPPAEQAAPAPAGASSVVDSGAPAGHSHHMTGMPAMAPIPPGALHTAADVHFMQGMIAHHGQALHMSRLAESRGANPRLLRLALKIDQSQEPEIRLMQEWLGANGQVAPTADSWRTVSMPGMLTAEQLTQLTAAKGADFDRQFLVLMIRHHEGALKMVADLRATRRAAQDIDVSVLATDIEITQTAEIAVMQQMLADY
jgi:uncharacterized protein (DUF305 family)